MFKAQFNISPKEFGFVLTARHSDFFFNQQYLPGAFAMANPLCRICLLMQHICLGKTAKEKFNSPFILSPEFQLMIGRAS